MLVSMYKTCAYTSLQAMLQSFLNIIVIPVGQIVIDCPCFLCPGKLDHLRTQRKTTRSDSQALTFELASGTMRDRVSLI